MFILGVLNFGMQVSCKLKYFLLVLLIVVVGTVIYGKKKVSESGKIC